jgi:hypothetical protein
MRTTVEVLFFDGCPNHRPAVDLAKQVVADLVPDVHVEEVQVRDAEDAARLRFLGSPTIRVDGVDIEPEARTRNDFTMSCRLYGGLPSVRRLGPPPAGAARSGPGQGFRAAKKCKIRSY